MSNGNGNTFWKVAGPVFAALVLGAIGLAGALLDQRLGRIEDDVQHLIRMHMTTSWAPETTGRHSD